MSDCECSSLETQLPDVCLERRVTDPIEEAENWAVAWNGRPDRAQYLQLVVDCVCFYPMRMREYYTLRNDNKQATTVSCDIGGSKICIVGWHTVGVNHLIKTASFDCSCMQWSCNIISIFGWKIISIQQFWILSFGWYLCLGWASIHGA